MTRVFVSYRRDDSAYVAATINERLEERFGTDLVFFDIDAIPLGMDFRKHISDSVGKCDVLLAIIGDAWVDAVDDRGNRRLDNPTDSVRLEIESALKRDIPVIPVLVDSAGIPARADLPPSLQDLTFRNAAEVRAGRDLQQHLASLVRGIEDLSRSEKPGEYKAAYGSPGTGGTGSPARKVPGQSTAAPPSGTDARRNPWKRWGFCIIALIASFWAGIGAGAGVAGITGSDAAGFIGAIPTWLAGIGLIVWVWRRY